ncbi:MAG TPA: RHS repeat domain-containing protein [Bryobacteraceae bacterium]|nr:RHS repeat domain-containing protein [Bryobacteraceae bacterium]
MSRLVRIFCVLGLVTACGYATSHCDVLDLGSTKIADVQQVINEALGTERPANDLNSDGVINVVDVYFVINAVLGGGCAADPGIVSIVPNAAQQGASGVGVTINGRLTNFTSGSSISLGAGITVSNVAASSPTVLTASLAIDSGATTGARTLTVDSLTLADAFTVTPPVSVSYTYDSQGRVATATYVNASGSLTIVTYSYDAAGNRTAVIAQ